MEHELPLICSCQMIPKFVRVPERARRRNISAKDVTIDHSFPITGSWAVSPSKLIPNSSARSESTATVHKMRATTDPATDLYCPGGSTLHTYTIYTCSVVCGAAECKPLAPMLKLTRGINFTLLGRLQSYFKCVLVLYIHTCNYVCTEGH